LDQNFRDESANVVKRAQKIYKKTKCRTNDAKISSPRQHVQSISSTSGGATIEFQRDNNTSNTLLSYDLSQAVEEVALTHFMSAFIPGSHFDYLPGMYAEPICSVGIALPATIHAASMALLAQELRHPEILTMARNAYAIALLETNSALAEPVAAIQDATLVSVLLLSLFEAIVWACPRTPKNWKMHTRGAFALINLRGSQQFNTSTGRKLFFQVATTICVDSIQQKIPLPPGLTALIEKVSMEYKDEAPHYQLACLTAKVSQLRADADDAMLTSEEVVDATRHLDKQYVSFGHSFPTDWKYETIALENSIPQVYGKVVHCYPNHRIAQLWNASRMTRILLNEMIYAYASWLPSNVKINVQRNAVANIQHMCEEICASIPQFATDRHTSSSLPSAIARSQCISTRAASASLLWPLSAIRGASLASESIRTYAMDRLKYIGRESRVAQVEKVAQESFGPDALQNGLHMLFLS
jgi:hypothetical protein